MHITVHSAKGHDSFLLEPQLYTPHVVHTLEGRWKDGLQNEEPPLTVE
jgi:homoserine O-acetyltransferase